PALEGETLPILSEATEHDYLEPERQLLLLHLREHYDGAPILVDAGKLAPLVYDSGLPTRAFLHNEGDPRLWRRALERPDRVAGWIAALQGDEVSQALSVDPRRLDGYSLAVRTDHFVLYRRQQ